MTLRTTLEKALIVLALTPLLALTACQSTVPSGDAASSPSSSATGDTKTARVVSLGRLDRIPAVKKPGTLVYPQGLYDRRVEGDVVLLIRIDEQGRVVVEEVLESTHKLFALSATQTAQTTVFEPPTVGGQPVSARFEIPYNFRIRENVIIRPLERRRPGDL
jgi:TonB family protein